MSGKNIVESMREIVQDLLVPELKAVKVSVDALRTEMKLNNDALRTEMKLNNDAIREEMKLSNEAIREEMKLNNDASREEMKLNNDAVREEMKLRFEMSERHTESLIKSLADRFDTTADLRERMASIEARMPRQ